jgi:hypothetical protein
MEVLKAETVVVLHSPLIPTAVKKNCDLFASSGNAIQSISTNHVHSSHVKIESTTV